MNDCYNILNQFDDFVDVAKSEASFQDFDYLETRVGTLYYDMMNKKKRGEVSCGR